MSPLLHPYLSLLYTLCACGFCLLFRRGLFGWFCILNVAQYLAWVTAFVTSPDSLPYWYYYSFWATTWALDALALAFALRYGIRYCRGLRIGKGNAGILMGALFALAMGMILVRTGSGGAVLEVNYAVRFAVTGVVCLMLICVGGDDDRRRGRIAGASGMLRDRSDYRVADMSRQQLANVPSAMSRSVMQGFAALYLGGLVTSGLFAWVGGHREGCWGTDLLIQLGVVSWWFLGTK